MGIAKASGRSARPKPAAGKESETSGAQDPRYSASTIPASTLAGLVTYAELHGHDVERWFDGSGIKARQTADPDARLSFRQIVRIITRALDTCGDIGLGLAIGSQTTVPSLGLLGFSLMSSRDMAEAAAVGARFHPVSGSLMDFTFSTHGDELILESFERFPVPGLLPFFCEKLFASTLATVRGLLGPGFHPARIEFSYPAPSYAGLYRQLFKCPVQFRAGHNRMITNPELLQRSLPTHSPSTHTDAMRLCESRMNAVTTRDEISSLRQWLRANQDRSHTIAEAAAALHLHERTLRRHLAEAGTCYRAINNAERAARATALLQDARLGISEVAARLGFSDDREFRRAYKRWTGQLPSAVRS